MKITATNFILLIITPILLYSCKKKVNPPPKFNDKSLSIKIQLPSPDEAILHVQSHANRNQKMVMVSTPYYETERKKFPCSQYDVDVNRGCSEPGSGAPYGYRWTTERVRKCCKSEPKLVTKVTRKWVANYIEQKNEWEVTLESKNESENTLS